MKIAVFENDMRMKYLVQKLSKYHEIIPIKNDIQDLLADDIDVLVLPVNAIDDKGNFKNNNQLIKISKKIWNQYKNKYIFTGMYNSFFDSFQKVYYYMEEKEVISKNAIYTAEGVLFLLIDMTSKCIQDLKVDVIGYGICGKEIVRWLERLQVKTRIVRRSCDNDNNCIDVQQYRFLEPADVIINTSIAPVIEDLQMKKWDKKPCIIDIATPNVINHALAKELGIRSIKAGSLPSIVASESAAILIANYIEGVLQHEK